MAPNKSKRGNGASSAAAAASMPKFTADALTQLTAKIDQNLENRNAQKLNGNSNGAGKRKRGADAGGDDDKEPAGAKPPKTQKKKAAAARPPNSKAKPARPEKTAKKTSSGANDIPVGKTKEASSETAEEAEEEEEVLASPDKKAIMLDEIKALGGDEADLELVDGIDSDAEEDNRSSGKQAGNDDLSLDASFQSELAKFAAGLGFDQVQLEDEDDDFMEREAEAEAEAEDEDEDEDEDEQEDEEEEEEQVEEAKPTAPEPPKKETKPAPSTDPFPKNPRFSKLMLEPRPDWHHADLETLPAPTSDDITPFLRTINNLKAYADTLLEADSAAYKSISAHSSSHRFMSTIMNSGTQSDKVSALTLEVQEAPIHNSKAFEQLVSLASKRSRGPAIAALAALVDLLGNGVVLPDNRRLRTFQAQPELLGALQTAGPLAHVWNAGYGNDPVLPGKITKAHLMVWKYEDWLKDQFFQILQQLEVWCNDEIEYSRTRSLDFIYGLLKSKPEQEANLLRLLVNKLGDRERKIASRASYLLLQLTNIHPGMKTIVINTIEQEALLRPGQSLRAKYYAINTLNQTILSNKDPATADSLVRIYFELFLVLLKSGALGAIDLTTGQDANAAAERAAKDAKKKKYRRGDKDHKNAETKTAPAKNEGNERDVAEKLVSGLLTGVNRAIPFANTDNTTLEGHIDTLFRITHSSNFNTSIQALMLVQQVAASKQVAVERFYRTLYESLLDPRLVTSSKQAMYLNLLFRSLKNDVDVRRVKAFVKRMLQIATLHQPPFVCGILFMISELETTFPDLKALINEPEFDEEDEEEHYHDVPEDGEGAVEPVEAKKPRVIYDGRKRDPEYSNAQRSCLWELLPFFEHYHPSVTAYASNLLVRQKTLVKPDIANHTLMHFLDKFVYRNPRAVDVAAANAGLKKARGTSIMQPMAAASATGAAQVVAPGKAGVDGARKNVAINSAAFWRQDAKDVAVEDIFFHTYFTQVGKQSQTSRAAKRAAKQDKATADGEDAGSDADEEEIWQALKGSRPEIEGGDDADADAMADMSDDDLSGLESLLNMSDDDDDDGLSLDGDDMDVDGDDGGVEFANFSDDDDDDEEGGARVDKDGLVSVGGEDDPRKASRERKKKFKSMPTFASADDYAEMLAAEADDF